MALLSLLPLSSFPFVFLKRYQLLTSALAIHLDPDANSNSTPNQSFPLLLLSFLTSQVLSPKLSNAAFISLFQHLFDSIKSQDQESEANSSKSQLIQTILDVISSIYSELDMRRELQSDTPLEIKEKLTQQEKQRRVLQHRDDGNVYLQDEMKENGGKILKLKEARNTLVGIVRQLIVSIREFEEDCNSISF